MREASPRLFTVARNLDAAIGDCWDNMWSPIFDGAVSDQRVGEFLDMQQSIVQMRPLSGESGAQEWEKCSFLSSQGLH